MPIVEAVAVSANSGGAGSKFEGKGAGRVIQSAMTKAVEDAYAEGITEPAEIGKRMQDARRRAVQSLSGNPEG